MEKIKVNMEYSFDENYLKEMREAYKACPKAMRYIAKLGIPEEKVEENITKIYDFVCDINYCSNCPGYFKCQKNNPHLVHNITYKYGYVDRTLSPCKKALNRIAFENQFIIHDFQDRWLDEDLMKSVDKTTTKTKAMMNFNEYLSLGKNKWIYLYGVGNTGRSYLAAALCMEAAKKARGPICYLDTPRRLGELNDLYFKDKDRFNARLEAYSTCNLLVLDDFGNEFKNDLIRDAILFPILNSRNNKKLMTIITSDFKIDEIVELYSTSKAGAIRAEQLGKIIKGNCEKEISIGEMSVY